MPFFLIAALGGAGISYALIESGYVWEAFWLIIIWIILLWTFPVLSLYFVMLLLALGVLGIVVAWWEFFAGITLGFILFLFIFFGIFHALGSIH